MPALAPGTGAAGTPGNETGYTCPKCGSWVVETTLHSDWHMAIEPSASTAPPAESIAGWNAASEEIRLLRTALGDETV